MNLTVKEACLKSLGELAGQHTYMEIYNHLVDSNYYDSGTVGKTPWSTISAQLGELIRTDDARLKRVKSKRGYLYYLTKNEANIDFESVETAVSEPTNKSVTSKKSLQPTYKERDLHTLLSTFLSTSDTAVKTIMHEQSNGKDTSQTWIHPDMVGVTFLKLKSNSSRTLLKAINRADTFKISAYELKREINNDSDLKQAYFQAVSNSSWANYGYLVAFEISDNLEEEIKRLNESFGIGVIHLKANPFESRILFQPKLRTLDFKTIDKLCAVNPEFSIFIDQIEKLLTANDKYMNAAQRELVDFCDSYLQTDAEIAEYCEAKCIPINDAAFVDD